MIVLFKCFNCNDIFRYKDIFKSQKNFKLKCPICESNYILKSSYYWFVSLLFLVPGLFSSYSINLIGEFSLVIYLFFVFIILLIMPFFYKFKLENNKN
ncbi:TIGR04104 family putative zinc finger protein [Clostridium perfringens]|uniref:TIGR04104 family putative zinc finger protein n=1 Tax=Clostridium perfringens TaxID=1502 RepID=UPI0039EA2DE4